MTRRIIAGSCAVSLAVSAAAAFATVASAAPTAVCEQYVTRVDPVTQQPTVVCVKWSNPPGEGDNNEGPGDGDGNGNAEEDCWWEPYPIPAGVVPDRPAGVSPDASMYWEICLNSVGQEYVGPGGAQWIEPAQVPAPSPAQVATQLRVQVAASLMDPVVATDPPEEDASIVTVPTFVSVTNWQGEVVEDGCDASGTVCVTITATPTLTFDPGEPGAQVVACEPGGTRYDPAGPPPDEQAAADGACAYPYRRRTGVAGRPTAWTASVTISWDVSWEGGGRTGTFTDISATEVVDRQVDEVQAVVTAGSG